MNRRSKVIGGVALAALSGLGAGGAWLCHSTVPIAPSASVHPSFRLAQVRIEGKPRQGELSLVVALGVSATRERSSDFSKVELSVDVEEARLDGAPVDLRFDPGTARSLRLEVAAFDASPPTEARLRAPVPAELAAKLRCDSHAALSVRLHKAARPLARRGDQPAPREQTETITIDTFIDCSPPVQSMTK